MISTKTRFLIVDDYDMVLTMLKENLRTIGFKGDVINAADGQEGFDALAAQEEKGEPVQFIISDLLMPGMSGLDFLKQVRADDKYKDIPFLILTSDNDSENMMNVIKCGASNILLKPWTADSLTEKIALCWNKHEKK
ncbi:MAG: response regulator [Bacteriovoracaceae bacterium]|jgi:two-component system, chemotaxis family, chemotaxis protein CheY|nr:response regulator [Bacteriovoracaceae bacterium]